MTYFCFIKSPILSVPQMEPLLADDLDGAKQEGEALLDRWRHSCSCIWLPSACGSCAPR